MYPHSIQNKYIKTRTYIFKGVPRKQDSNSVIGTLWLVKSLSRKFLSVPDFLEYPHPNDHRCELMRITLYRGLKMFSNGIVGITSFRLVFSFSFWFSVPTPRFDSRWRVVPVMKFEMLYRSPIYFKCQKVAGYKFLSKNM